MLRQLICAILLTAFAGAAFAQDRKTITLRVLDGKTGEKVTPDNIKVSFKNNSKIDTTWVKLGDDDKAEVRIPAGATVIALKATYDASTSYYVDCDVARQKKTTEETWYPIADILSAGLKIPNDCVKPKDADKVTVDVKPGEFVLFVRKKKWTEDAQE